MRLENLHNCCGNRQEESTKQFSTKIQIPKIYRKPSLFAPKKYNNSVPNVKRNREAPSQNEDSANYLKNQLKMHQNILDLEKRLGTSIVQKNGQRKLGPPPNWVGPPPGPGCEIFVGKLPRDIYEDAIYPLFSRVGKIYEVRLMMNFSGTNRGFCFIMYETQEAAQRAVRELNNYEIIPNWFIGVVISVNNCRLHITDLPQTVSAKKLVQKIWPVCEDIDRIYVFQSIYNPLTRHALIEFNTHRSAAMARRQLLPERSKFFDRNEVKIEWAHPKMIIGNVVSDYQTNFVPKKV
ncbi:hypothetical protein QAD02_017529 [Eretmocerus hayati]|uniref:Uncharacterized protein n=1 Tax=Eretmocerus hayati TaxID=131215 RepID=A0ACC2PE72_9HYME|nr:hypothetical protein QAD02_017529 [Eretmocerus hayati]